MRFSGFWYTMEKMYMDIVANSARFMPNGVTYKVNVHVLTEYL